MELNIKTAIIKTIKLFLGFFFLAYGINMMIISNAGLNPWGVFQQGLSKVTSLSFGQISQIVGLIMIILTLPFKIYPGIGTLLNMYFCGLFVDVTKDLCFIFNTNTVFTQYLVYFLGLILFTYGIFLYISCNLGAGPRDGLLIGLIKKTKINATFIKPAIELTVLIIGYLIGGTVGLGTLISAFFGGRILDLFFHLHHYDPKIATHTTIMQMIQKRHNRKAM